MTIQTTIGRQIACMQGLWVAGNLVSELPASIGALAELDTLILHANCLVELPSSLTSLSKLEVLGLSGNWLTSLPADIGMLSMSPSSSATPASCRSCSPT